MFLRNPISTVAAARGGALALSSQPKALSRCQASSWLGSAARQAAHSWWAAGLSSCCRRMSHSAA